MSQLRRSGSTETALVLSSVVGEEGMHRPKSTPVTVRESFRRSVERAVADANPFVRGSFTVSKSAKRCYMTVRVYDCIDHERCQLQQKN